MIVVIEGLDASGKATQSKLLASKLKGTRFSFPNYDSATGKAILGHLKKEWACGGRQENAAAWKLLDALVFQCLQTANRLELLPSIRKALEEGPVVFDRYWQSGCVYGGLEGLDYAWLRYTQEHPMPKADLNILIDIPVEEGFTRRPERRDRYEIDRLFLETVRAGYQALWADHYGADDYRWNYANGRTSPDLIVGDSGWYVVNGLGTVEEVHARIMTCISEARE